MSPERGTLLDSATEEFLRFFTPAPGDGRTISADCEIAGTQFKEGERRRRPRSTGLTAELAVQWGRLGAVLWLVSDAGR